MSDHKLFKINQDAILKNEEGEVLILEYDKKWKLPGGRLEDDSTSEEGLLREIKEETGITDCKIGEVVHVGLSESRKTYRITFLCSTPVRSVTLSEEHTGYKWIGLEDVDNYNFEFEETKEMLKKVMSE